MSVKNMELDENIYSAVNASSNFEHYGDEPIVPDMVKPVKLYEEDLLKVTESRRESNFSFQSDISLGTTTESESSLPSLRYLRAPSVVVSDHSEDTGCVTYDDIRRIQNAYNRRRRLRTGRRSSEAFGDLGEKYERKKGSESSLSGSTSTDTTEFFRPSQNMSPVPRRKKSGQNSLSFDEDFETCKSYEKKTLSECSSSNELSPIMSQCDSSNCSEDSSRRSSIFSEISPVLLRKNFSFDLPKGSNFFSEGKSPSKICSESVFHSCDATACDDTDICNLEKQRSLSYDDLYGDSSNFSDWSYSDLSTDFSACSSLSNLPGTVYYLNYANLDCDYYRPLKCSRRRERRKSGNIKQSKSCSDFLSVSRIAEDYPHLRHRRHSNELIEFEISDCCSQKEKDLNCEKWPSESNRRDVHKNIRNAFYSNDRITGCGNLAVSQLKSFHGSLHFQKDNIPIRKSKWKSSESVLYRRRKKSASNQSVSGWSIRDSMCLKFVTKPENNCSVSDKEAGDNRKVVVKKEWLSVDWKDSSFDGDTDYDRRKVALRKISDCSTCSNVSADPEVVENPIKAHTKAKGSGWRKLRSIVQWTPFFQIYKKQRYPWVQLAGHQGNFKAGPEQGTILKKLCPKEEKCYKILMKDVLRPYVPEYRGQVTCADSDSIYLQLQDLLVDFKSPCVLDCKLGVRTYLEEELQKAKEKPKLRKDMYEKMIQIDPTAPTLEEHRLKAVTKPRYMVWRETISSSSTLGFRLEGMRKSDGNSTKDFKTTKTREQVKEAFRGFLDGFPHSVPKYVQRLKAIKSTLEVSIFFSSHEVIGSSLLFVHDKVKANIWLIDFAKTILLPDQVFIDHKSQWEIGNHEDGYLIGVNNLIEIFSELEEEQRSRGEAFNDDGNETVAREI